MLKRLWTIAFIGLAAGRLGADDPVWVVLDLEGGQRLTGKLISQEEDSYTIVYEGSPLIVAKSSVKSIVPVSDDKEGARGEPKGSAGAPGAGPGAIRDAEAVRDAIDTLGCGDYSRAMAAYARLEKRVADARPLLHAALTNQSIMARALLVRLLGEKGNERDDAGPVTKRLADPSYSVRRAAILALRNFGPGGVPALLKHLNEEEEPNNRKLTVKAFQHWRDPRAIAPLVARLGRETDDGVKSFIAVALHQLTRQDLGTDAAAWEEYLEAEQRRQAEQKSKDSATARAARGEAGAGGTEEKVR